MITFSVLLSDYLLRASHLKKISSRQKSHFCSIIASSMQSNLCKHPLSCSSHRDIRRWNKTISRLIKNGRLHDAWRLFNEMPQRSVVTWNSIIRGYIQNGEIVRARKLFDEMPERDVVSWNVMLSGYVCGGGSRQLDEGRCLFDRMPERDSVSWNTMISGYARSRQMADALDLFHRMPERNVISWNAVITGFLQNGAVRRAMEVFYEMPNRDSASISALVSGLIQNGKLEEAEDILSKTGAMAGEHIIDAYNTLIAGYGQSGRVEKARELFDLTPFKKCPLNAVDEIIKHSRRHNCFERNIVSWNTMIMSYVKAGNMPAAHQLFNDMPERDSVSWNTMISGYVHILDLAEAAFLFYAMPDPDTCSWNFMISGYAQNGKLEIARNFFDRMPQKSLVSWNSMIAGYEQNGDYEGALELFFQMQAMCEKPDQHTYSSVLSACTGLTALSQGMLIHQRITKILIADIPIKNSLITMYARCGNIADARSIFDDMITLRDVISWNAMIGGYAQHGFASEALELFREMKEMKVTPTHITFISVLHACSHAGLVAEGRRQFDSMVSEFGIAPRVEHFASLVDVLGRHGHLEDAMELINRMAVEPDRAVWGALLGACRVHNDVDLAKVAAKELMHIEPESSAPYVMLYNMYVDAGRWNDAIEVRKMMETKKIRKQPGYSWIELHSKVHVFVAGDQSHPNADEVQEFIESCNRNIKDLDSEIQLSFIFSEE